MKNILFLCAMALVSMSVFADETSTPLQVSSGFNIDAIVVSPNDVPTSLGPIDGHGSQLIADTYEGVNAGEGIPVNGVLTTADNHKYQFADFMRPNCLYIGITDKDAHELGTPASGSLTFSTPTAADKLGILMCGTNRENLDLQFNLKVTYENGSESNLGTFKVSDWGQNNENDAVFTFKKRYRFDAGSNPESGSFHISEVVAALDNTTSGVKTVTITTECGDDAWGYGSLAFFAFTAISSNTNDIQSLPAGTADIHSVYAVDGSVLSAPVKGLNIVKYNNGIIRKVVN